jgi:phage recombination protein Bet
MSTNIVRIADWGLTEEQIELIKTAFARHATNDELALFVQTCNRLRLDPFARQIFLVKRWDSSLKRDVATTQVSIDGFRLIAERTGEYRGQTAPQWCGPDGKWVDVWLDPKQPPAAARVGVHRESFREPLVRTALWSAYAQYKQDGGLTSMWGQHGVN